MHDTAAAYSKDLLPTAADVAAELTPSEVDRALARIHVRGDRIVSRFLILHALIAVGLAFFYDTWRITGMVTVCALAMFALCMKLLPGQPLTRSVGGVSLQAFVALHIYQMHGLAEMHFFAFTGVTVMIVYHDWKSIWPGGIFIVLQHLAFALLHNAGTNVYFFEPSYVGFTKLAFHFGLAIAEVGICSFWAHLLRQQTLSSALQQKRVQEINERLRTEMLERHHADEALREANERYQRMANNVPGMVYQYVHDADGRAHVSFASDGAREVYELEPETITADVESITKITHPDDLDSMAKTIEQSAATMEQWRWEGRLCLDHDRTKWIQGFSRPTRRADGSICWDGVIIDITDRKNAEAELHKAKDEAERANLAKSVFLSRMSHELRTPLNAILGFSQLLELDPLTADQQQSVRHILKGGRHLLTLVNEVLDIAKIEAGELGFSVETISLAPLVNEMTTLVTPLATARKIALSVKTIDRRIHVLADMQRLKQVLLNLLSNAIKYNCDDGKVEIVCETLAAVDELDVSTAGWTRISVRDTGPGIAELDLPKLFTPFERLGADKLDIEGSGIGLALCKRLAEAMGGHIGVRTLPGVGSTFYIDLPTASVPSGFEENGRDSAEADSSNDAFSPTSGPAAARKKILYIEDNASNRQIVEKLISRRSEIQLLTAIQGQLGLELAREHTPDLILLDLHLPDLMGTEVLTRLQADPKTSAIPVIVLSADATPRQIQRLLSMGAWHYMTKPFDLANLLRVIDDVLEVPAHQLAGK